MNAPDILYLDEDIVKNPSNAMRGKPYEYISKDALLEWAKDMHEAYQKKYEESNHTCGEHWGQMVAFRRMIDKLNSF